MPIECNSFKFSIQTNRSLSTEAFLNQMKQVQKVYGTDDILVAIGFFSFNI